MFRLQLLACAAGLCAALPVIAAEGQTPARPPSDPPPIAENYTPPPPPPETPPHEIVPEVTIVTKGSEIHEEYRVNGRLYMIKVTPTKGKPYYLIDREGQGEFRRSDFAPSVAIPNWVILSW
ncbi:MAG: DUF2782 domain-containing protein [Pseudomonadota bacterium]|nr:MAG: DUF2782 domain-containing protein [Pseudomonadota bacterium]